MKYRIFPAIIGKIVRDVAKIHLMPGSQSRNRVKSASQKWGQKSEIGRNFANRTRAPIVRPRQTVKGRIARSSRVGWFGTNSHQKSQWRKACAERGGVRFEKVPRRAGSKIQGFAVESRMTDPLEFHLTNAFPKFFKSEALKDWRTGSRRILSGYAFSQIPKAP